MDLSQLLETPAVALQLELESFGPAPIQLPTFQDVGHAVFTRPDGRQSGILDTHGSMANRLEDAVWDDPNETVIDCLQQMPFVSVRTPSGQLVTASLRESHRLNSPYIYMSYLADGAKFEDYLAERLQVADGTPGGYPPKVAAIFAELDPCSLIHGTFMSYSKKFQLSGAGSKLTAALTGFAEAQGISPVEYGTGKQDRVNARGSAFSKTSQKESETAPEKGSEVGFGTFQTPATMWSAERIAAYYYLDIDLLRSYRLGDTFLEWAVGLSLLKILRFIERGLRLRSRCILQPQLSESGHIALDLTLPIQLRGNYFDWGLPDRAQLEQRLEQLTQQLHQDGTFGDPMVLRDGVTGRS